MVRASAPLRKAKCITSTSFNPLHQLLLAELGRIQTEGPGGQPQTPVPGGLLRVSEPGLEVTSVGPVKSLDTEPIGALALYSYASEDYFGTMKKRIIEEYMDNFASALIIALIAKASQENQRMKELLESYGERISTEAGISPGGVFDGREATEFRGVGAVVEHLLRRAGGESVPGMRSWRIWSDFLSALPCGGPTAGCTRRSSY